MFSFCGRQTFLLFPNPNANVDAERSRVATGERRRLSEYFCKRPGPRLSSGERPKPVRGRNQSVPNP
ncbi:hypothetical protein L596_011891 [Steinernema carpocapsae]|uniref:Uncharacterized protein n=1 Tax=Steinernema carpocapsae TaxID=34508 RepID=A0A4U5NVS3_STECR|nr:hypothetical protein L596_011891 [Steinernema carpocapsae]